MVLLCFIVRANAGNSWVIAYEVQHNLAGQASIICMLLPLNNLNVTKFYRPTVGPAK